MKIYKFALGLFLVWLCASTAYSLEVEGFTPDKQVIYKTVGDTELKIHIFNPAGHKLSDSRAAMVFFFGGGWNSGSPSQFYPHCSHLAARGMVCMAADYRVKSRNGTTPRESVMDGNSAVRWVRKNAGELGIDPGRIAAGGGSAGGQVAAATGMTVGVEEENEGPGISSQPNALVLFNPVFDLGPDGYEHKRVKDFWQEISPMHNIDANTPPTIVFFGTKDDLVPVDTAVKYKALMEGNGFFTRTNHMLFSPTKTQKTTPGPSPRWTGSWFR